MATLFAAELVTVIMSSPPLAVMLPIVPTPEMVKVSSEEPPTRLTKSINEMVMSAVVIEPSFSLLTTQLLLPSFFVRVWLPPVPLTNSKSCISEKLRFSPAPDKINSS